MFTKMIWNTLEHKLSIFTVYCILDFTNNTTIVVDEIVYIYT